MGSSVSNDEYKKCGLTLGVMVLLDCTVSPTAVSKK